MNIFVINGHKYYPFSEGRLNQTLFDEIVELAIQDNSVKTTIVENGYDINEEIEKYKWADIIIYQSPVNWFSVPWILKKYFDEIFLYGIFYAASEEYGQGGLMNGKKYMYSMTWNSALADFNKPGFFDDRSDEDLILALHKFQEYCGFERIKSFFCHDVVKQPDIPVYLEKLKIHLNKYVLK